MCKAWTIKYVCTHAYQFRLSTCRGFFTARSKPTSTPKAVCSGASLLVFKSVMDCGDCQRTQAEDQARHRKEDIYAPSPDTLKRTEADAEYDREMWRLRRNFPASRFEQRVRAQAGKRTSEATRSPLRSEISPEEVEEPVAWDWCSPSDVSGCPSLADEIAEDEDSTDEAGRGFEADMAEAHRLFFEDSPSEEEGLLHSVDAGSKKPEHEDVGDRDATQLVTTEAISFVDPNSGGESSRTRLVLPPHKRHRQKTIETRSLPPTNFDAASDSMFTNVNHPPQRLALCI